MAPLRLALAAACAGALSWGCLPPPRVGAEADVRPGAAEALAALAMQYVNLLHEQSAMEFQLVPEADGPLWGRLRSLEPIPVDTPAIAQALAARMPAGTVLQFGDTLRASKGSLGQVQAVIRMTHPRVDGDALVVMVFTRGGHRGGTAGVYAVSFETGCTRPRVRLREGCIG